jgi:hypothetical protein
MLSKKLYRMTFKTFGHIDLHTGVILSTCTSLRGSNAMTDICDGAKYGSVAVVSVGTSGRQTLLYINYILTLVLNNQVLNTQVLNTQALYPLGKRISNYMLQCF